MIAARRSAGFFVFLCLFFSGVSACAQQSSAPAPEDAFTPLRVITKSGPVYYRVEIADEPAERGRGLMFRQKLPADEGMLFDMGVTRMIGMWMKNTYVSLDMLFIDEHGIIRHIEPRTTPLSEDTISSRMPVRYVLELRAGEAERRGIETGDRVDHMLFGRPISLPGTFRDSPQGG